MQNLGQINRGSVLGDFIYDIVKSRNDVITIVESGTWNGLGTTRCVLDGLRDDQYFCSIELYPDMHQVAVANNSKHMQRSNVKFLLGTLVSYEETFWFEHSQINFNKDAHAQLWYHKDMELLKTSRNIINEIPRKIDLLILDGGEYSTYPEWVRLKNRTKIVVLDDSSILKCNKIATELSNDPNYKCLINRPNERNGFAIYEKTI